MGMPLELNTMIVTKGNEVRQQDNQFTLKKEGYRLYPIDIPIELRHTIESDYRATAVIEKLEWEDQQTIITYQLLALHSSN
ncbi:DUF2584 domain-containing protein [Lederbergia sp. NSJ-179]|uniref:DUF2584 domain-containing protein n=1 Tax=Lederbergia sp. NSJ-179 TaxID=2931402 RepID=UPI001FD1A1D2|nr:DUF2584 domain-containing protein [Lederbergia sp. NSJ-179]MCJ7842675.1 DUF2584 domain-containing protein [Lederbergia sp. NSJ-179]